MATGTYLYRLAVSNTLTIIYSILNLGVYLVNTVKNSLWSPPQKPMLVPPPKLTDPNYGVHKYIKANNIKLHYVEKGDPSKPLMLFVHGFPEFWYSWRYQQLEFSKDYWCVSIDTRGYGDSERPEDVASYHIDILIEDLRDLLRQLGREKCILVGHDWGGLLACRFRDLHPECVTALIVLGSTSRETWLNVMWSSFKQIKMSWYVFFFRMPVLPELLLQSTNSAFLDAMLVPGKVCQEDIDCYKYWFTKQSAYTPPINYYRANFLYELKEKNRCDKNIPFLVVNAEKDAYLSTSLLDSMKKEYTCIETVLLENCRHFLQQENPEKVNSLIKQFLTKHNV